MTILEKYKSIEKYQQVKQLFKVYSCSLTFKKFPIHRLDRLDRWILKYQFWIFFYIFFAMSTST